MIKVLQFLGGLLCGVVLGWSIFPQFLPQAEPDDEIIMGYHDGQLSYHDPSTGSVIQVRQQWYDQATLDLIKKTTKEGGRVSVVPVEIGHTVRSEVGDKILAFLPSLSMLENPSTTDERLFDSEYLDRRYNLAVDDSGGYNFALTPDAVAEDVRKIYTTNDTFEAKSIMDKYNASHLMVYDLYLDGYNFRNLSFTDKTWVALRMLKGETNISCFNLLGKFTRWVVYETTDCTQEEANKDAGQIRAKTDTGGLPVVWEEKFNTAASWTNYSFSSFLGDPKVYSRLESFPVVGDSGNRAIVATEYSARVTSKLTKYIDWPTNSKFLKFDYVFIGVPNGKERLIIDVSKDGKTYSNTPVIYEVWARDINGDGFTTSPALDVSAFAGGRSQLRLNFYSDAPRGAIDRGKFVIDNIIVYGEN